MKATLLDHVSLGPYKESLTIVQIQMLFHAVGHSFHSSGGSYTPEVYILIQGLLSTQFKKCPVYGGVGQSGLEEFYCILIHTHPMS